MDIAIIIFTLIVLMFSIMIHEVAHGSMALSLGDPTAKLAGRLTLNPLRHLDPFGSVSFPLFLFLITNGKGPIFGWTKPVPVNPFNFRDQKWGNLKVSLAGPLANFSIAVFFALLIRFTFGFLSDGLLSLFAIISVYNFAWGLFNLVPIMPLDGFHILSAFIPEKFSRFLRQYSLIFFFLFIFIGGLNLVFRGAHYLFGLFFIV